VDPVGYILASLALYGCLGLTAFGLAERFIPVIPSYALLVAIGAAAAEGLWPLLPAIAATAFGGTVGFAISCYAVGFLARPGLPLPRVGDRQPFAPLHGFMADWVAALKTNSTRWAYLLQLIPTARFLAPALIVVLGTERGGFMLASALGILSWNATFIGVGYAAASLSEIENATSLALTLLVCLLLIQVAVFGVWRRLRGQ
jgi:membrane protein DedA with SNARE-associated domain